jgi:hypothetical protein
MRNIRILSVVLVAILALTGCSQSRGELEYDSTTGAYLAGAQSGNLLLSLNPDKNYSKAWVEKTYGKIEYNTDPGVIESSFVMQPAFDVCSPAAQIAYPDWSTGEHDQYIDYLAGCLEALGWTTQDHDLIDISSNQ